LPGVLLPCVDGRDPLGELALERSLRAFLPGFDIMPYRDSLLRAPFSPEGRRADAVVIAGCQLFGTGSAVAVNAAVLRGMALAGSLVGEERPFALVGVSAGGSMLRSDRWAARQLIRRSHLVLLSDDESASALADAGAPAPFRVSSDPVWWELRSVSSGSGSGRSVLVIIDGGVGPSVEVGLTLGLAEVVRGGLDVSVLPWGPANSSDRRAAEKLAVKLSDVRPGCVELLPGSDDLRAACEQVADAMTVITLRYRGLHAAAAAGVPAVGVAIEPRIASLARRLGQRWLEPGDLAGSLPQAIEQATCTPAPSPSAVKEEVTRAEAGLSLLRLVLERGDLDAAELESLPLAPRPWL
jgi:polysaccharide pyruvyl transferase WcaK-like protein